MEGRLLIWLIVQLFKLIYLLLRTVFRVLRALVGLVARPERAEPVAPPLATRAPVTLVSVPPERAAVDRLAARLRDLASRARALELRCAAEPSCAGLLPTLRELVLPQVDGALVAVRHATGATDLEPLAFSAAELDALTKLVSRMADQRCDPSYDDLIDDADTLAAACYQPVVDYCRTNDVPLSSDRALTVFGDDCSPWLGRIDDPTGLAILHLPWTWMAEVHRWPAIGHEVGHDFYESIEGLDDEVLRRHGLTGAAEDASVLDGKDGIHVRDIDRIVTRWRHELVADAFGVMMLGPAYVVTTAAIFERSAQPLETLAVQVDDDGTDYEVHPPGHVRVVALCRLLARMGYGAVGVTMEQKWRARHGEPVGLLLPVPEGWLRVADEPFLDRAVMLTASLYQEGFAALRGIPLASMPGFDFGPREHEAALRARDAFLADGSAPPSDPRLLIAGAVLAWAERPGDNARLLRAARRAVGRLPAPVASSAGAPAPRASTATDLLRDAFLLDVLLAPPVSQRGRGPQRARG